jgi:hypothetical protein
MPAYPPAAPTESMGAPPRMRGALLLEPVPHGKLYLKAVSQQGFGVCGAI